MIRTRDEDPPVYACCGHSRRPVRFASALKVDIRSFLPSCSSQSKVIGTFIERGGYRPHVTVHKSCSVARREMDHVVSCDFRQDGLRRPI